MVAGASWREEMTENEPSTGRAQISASRDPQEEELRRFLSALATALNALAGTL